LDFYLVKFIIFFSLIDLLLRVMVK